ncbi:MAG: M23 family metallopeptidase [Planctomycetes bacterium]|nr:M23 family metallopeptidase [Planctomycetota bacterium]
MALLIALLLALPLAALQAESPCAWGGDIGRGNGAKLVDSVRGELRALVKLAPEARAKKAADLARTRAVAAIEAWKRYREPELLPLARACLDHADWHVVHRALFWLERLHDAGSLPAALARLDHAEPRLRERAALAALALFGDLAATAPDEAAARRAPFARSVAERLERERDPHVRSALRALQQRLVGDHAPRRLGGELQVRAKGGLLLAPLLTGLEQRESLGATIVQAGVAPFAERDEGRAELPIATLCVAPLLDYGREEVPRLVLQPFGQGRRGGAVVHTGQDVGGCFDGAGLYAIADGVVRSISGGGDAGVRLVVEHRFEKGEQVDAVYMHAAPELHVAVGEVVTTAQLLGTVGLSWSDENGGQFAHLHFGLYPGPYRDDHNYGYRAAGDGDLSDWLDPQEWLAARGVPVVVVPKGADGGR